MKRFLCVQIMLCILFLLLPSGSVFSQEISLDDNPSNPITGPLITPYSSAEDEGGFLLPPLIGPSPSLGLGPFLDSDILQPGPAGPLLSFLPFSYVDGVSSDHNPDNNPAIHTENPWISLRFSVDRMTGGLTTADASFVQAQNLDQPADIYQGGVTFQHPGFFCPAPPPVAPPFGGVLPTAGTGAGSANTQVYDNVFFGLGPHPDNIDAYNEQPALNPGNYVYFTPHYAETALLGISAADIIVLPPGGTLQVYAPAYRMGLDVYGGTFTDSIDALVVWDNGEGPARHFPDLDYALFSLAPGSFTLTTLQWMGFPVDGGTVFFTTFYGTFYIYAYSTDLGVGPFPVPPLMGNPNDTNIDALEIW